MELNLDHLTREEARTLLGVSAKSMELYVKRTDDPLPFYEEAGKFRWYKWNEVLAWKIRFEVGKLPQKAFKAKDSLDAAKLEGVNLDNKRKLLESAVREGELLEAKEVAQTWSDALVTIRQSLISVGHNAASQITDGMTYAQKKTLIDTGIFASLNTVITDAEG